MFASKYFSIKANTSGNKPIESQCKIHPKNKPTNFENAQILPKVSALENKPPPHENKPWGLGTKISPGLILRILLVDNKHIVIHQFLYTMQRGIQKERCLLNYFGSSTGGGEWRFEFVFLFTIRVILKIKIQANIWLNVLFIKNLIGNIYFNFQNLYNHNLLINSPSNKPTPLISPLL